VIFIVVKHPVKPQYAEHFEELVEPFTSATRAEPGTICFDWYRSVEDPELYLLVEAFRDAEAGMAHVESEHFRQAIAALPAWLKEVPEIVHVEVPGEGWSRMSEIEVVP